MTSLRLARQLMLLLALVSTMLLGACRDDGLINPPDDNENDSCCAVISVAVSGTNGGALQGVAVALRKGMDVVQTRETNAQGIATFSEVCNAEYNLRLTKNGYAVAEKGDIFITSCDTTRIAMAMRGTNTTDPNDTCCTSVLRLIPTDADGRPVAGAQVKLTGPNGVIRTVESTLDGAIFRELCRGAYMIRIARQGFQVHESRIEIGCGVELVERRMLHAGDKPPLDSCCQARLVVGARDGATNEILNGTTIKLWKGGQMIRSLVMQGRAVVFEELCEGSYGISFHREGYRPLEAEVRVSCNSVEEVWRNLSRVEGQDSCCNNVAVVHLLDGSTRRPIANAAVKLVRAGAVVATVRSNDDGVARFERVCQGEYGVVASHERYRVEDMHINVICGRGAEATLVLMPNAPKDTCCNASLGLRVLDGARDAEIGLMGVTVVIKAGTQVIAQGMTNREGGYTRGELCNHRVYVVVLEKEGYQRLALEVPIEECGQITKTVRMIPR